MWKLCLIDYKCYATPPPGGIKRSHQTPRPWDALPGQLKYNLEENLSRGMHCSWLDRLEHNQEITQGITYTTSCTHHVCEYAAHAVNMSVLTVGAGRVYPQGTGRCLTVTSPPGLSPGCWTGSCSQAWLEERGWARLRREGITVSSVQLNCNSTLFRIKSKLTRTCSLFQCSLFAYSHQDPAGTSLSFPSCSLFWEV